MLKVRLDLRKVVAIAICLASFSVGNVLAQDNTTDQGVVINGVKWATCNVDKPGTFTPNSEDMGMYYEWGSRVGWNATHTINSDGGTTGGSHSIGATWEKSNDPSPVGWRMPTLEEFETLLDTDKVSNKWTVQNGVSGRKFTDKTTGNSVFLPAVSYENGASAIYYCRSIDRRIGSRSEDGHFENNVYELFFDSDNVYVRGTNSRWFSRSIRAVTE